MSLFPILDDEKKPPPPPPPSLFPVTEESSNSRSLFPSASSYPAPPPPPPSNKEWLSNSSFQQSKEEESSSDSESESSDSDSEGGKGKEVAIRDSESDEEDEDSEEEHRRKKQKRQRKREKKEKKEKKRKKRSDKEKILELERKQQKADPRTASDIWKMKDPTKVYFFDAKGDQNNMVFGALYRLDIPSYFKSRKALGLGKDLGLNYTKAGYYLYRRSAQDNAQKVRYLSKKHAVKESDVDLKRVNLAGRRFESQEVTPDFIRIEEPSSAPSEQDEGETYEDYLTSRTKSFSQYTRENPHDIKTWLEFVKFQDEFLNLGKKHSRAAIVEKKIALLNRAIEENPNNEILILLLLRESSLLWESDKVLNLWKKVISDHSKNPNMWKEYLKFLQSNFSTFSISQQRKSYALAINSLLFAPSRFIEMSLLDIFIQLCYFEKQSGFSEKCVAYFQAMIEFNFSCPQEIVDVKSMLRYFEGFWESEVPRFGDEGRVGWKKWMETRQEMPVKRSKKVGNQHHVAMDTEVSTVELPAHLIQGNEEQEAEKAIFAEWVQEEESRDRVDWFPCRPLVGVGLQEGQELEDPERVVLFEDIQGFLFRFISEDLKIELVYRFLEFLGVNELPNRQCSNDVYRQQRIQNLEETGKNFGVTEFKIKEELFQILVSKKSWSTDKQIKEPSLVNFIRNVFQQSSQMFPDNIDLVLAHLSFESIYSVEEARKMAKNLLKIKQTEIILWNWYANFEKKAGKIEDARKVCSTALSLQHQLPAKSQLDSPALFRTYAEMEISLGNRDNALNALCCVFDPPFTPLKKGETVSPTKIMKAKKSYEQKMPLKNPTDKNLHLVVCFALFEYLTSGIDSACKVFEIELQRYAMIPIAHEELAMSYAQIVSNHSQKVPTPPGLLRTILTKAMSIYPTNTQFLTMFIELEARSQIANRIRSYFDDICASRPSPVLWLFSIHTETARLGASHRIRTLFEKALDNPDSRTCIALWRYYMDYETSKGNADLAKGIFYRSIRNVPWAKSLWLDAFRHLRPLMATSELHDILKLMMEKEIHLRQLPKE